MRRVGSIDQRWECARRQNGLLQAFNINSEHLELADQIPDRIFYQYIDDFCEGLGMAIGHHPRRRLIRRALSGHHVSLATVHGAPQKPISAILGSSSRRTRRKASKDLVPVLQKPPVARPVWSTLSCGVSSGSSRGPSPEFELDRAAERIGDDRQISEKMMGASKLEAADRLQRHLGGSFWRQAQIEETAGLGADFALLRGIRGRLCASSRPGAGVGRRCESTSTKGFMVAFGVKLAVPKAGGNRSGFRWHAGWFTLGAGRRSGQPQLRSSFPGPSGR